MALRQLTPPRKVTFCELPQPQPDPDWCERVTTTTPTTTLAVGCSQTSRDSFRPLAVTGMNPALNSNLMSSRYIAAPQRRAPVLSSAKFDCRDYFWVASPPFLSHCQLYLRLVSVSGPAVGPRCRADCCACLPKQAVLKFVNICQPHPLLNPLNCLHYTTLPLSIDGCTREISTPPGSIASRSGRRQRRR